MPSCAPAAGFDAFAAASPLARQMTAWRITAERVQLMEPSMWRIGVTGILALATLLVPPARADDVADFYKGKRINLIVSYGTGGGYDVYARVLARHMGRHIPGNPSIVVQNMPGAGSLRGANYHLQRGAQGRHRLRHLRTQHGAHRPSSRPTRMSSSIRRKFTWLGSSSSLANDAYILLIRSRCQGEVGRGGAPRRRTADHPRQHGRGRIERCHGRSCCASGWAST